MCSLKQKGNPIAAVINNGADTSVSHIHLAGGSHGLGFAYIRESDTSHKVTPYLIDYAHKRVGRTNKYKWMKSPVGYGPVFDPDNFPPIA